MKKRKVENNFVEVHVTQLTSGSIVASNDSKFVVVRVDPIIDPRGGVYEDNTTEVIASLENGTSVILSGIVTVIAA